MRPVFTNYTNERKFCTKLFNYTITFRDVEKIPNKYRQYAQQQTVRDENMFFGRDSLLHKLFDAISIKNDNGNDVLKGGNGIVLYGKRRSGKTSILYHLEKKIIRDMQHTIVVNLGSSARSISNSGDADGMSKEKLQELNANMTLQNLYYLIILGVKSFIRAQESEPIVKLARSLLDDFLAKEYMQNYGFKQELLEPQYVDAGKLEWTEKIKLTLGLIARKNSKKVTSNVIPWSEFNEYVIIRDDILKDRNIPSEEMCAILERLVKRQVIETQEGYQNRFRIKIPLCREWILRRGGAEILSPLSVRERFIRDYQEAVKRYNSENN